MEKIADLRFFLPGCLFKAGRLFILQNIPPRMLIQDRTAIRVTRVLSSAGKNSQLSYETLPS